MKKSLLFLLLSILFSINIKSQDSEYFWIGIGPTYNGLLGKGNAGDRFNYNIGFGLEMGFNFANNWQWMIWGLSAYSTTNQIYESNEKVNFLVPYYTEVRLGFFRKNIESFGTFGIGACRMKFKENEGHDYQFLYAVGLGARLLFKFGNYIQIIVRPYGVTGNQLGYKYGTELSLNLGFWTR